MNDLKDIITTVIGHGNSVNSYDAEKVLRELQSMFEERNILDKETTVLRKEISSTKERYEQTIHTMKTKIQNYERMELDYQEEISKLQQELISNNELRCFSSDLESRLQIAKEENKELRSVLDQYQKQQTILETRISELDEQLTSSPRDITAQYSNTSLYGNDELVSLQVKVAELEKDKDELAKHCIELKQECMIKSKLEQELLMKQVEIDEIRQQLSSLTRSLEVEKERSNEYQVELENIRSLKGQPTIKGSSVFGELEDGRVKAEKKFGELHTKYESVKSELQKEKNLRSSLKIQLSSLLTINAHANSSNTVERLNALLAQVTRDKQGLMTKLVESETRQKAQQNNFHGMVQKCSLGDNKSYINFLEAMLKQKESQIDSMKNELSDKNITIHSRTEKSIEYHQQLIKFENEIKNLKIQMAQKDLDIHELKIEINSKILDQSMNDISGDQINCVNTEITSNLSEATIISSPRQQSRPPLTPCNNKTTVIEVQPKDIEPQKLLNYEVDKTANCVNTSVRDENCASRSFVAKNTVDEAVRRSIKSQLDCKPPECKQQ